ncbi:MAG: outer membrane protein assembly factor BamB [Actinomycetia bacterium]|nr:outer membrane protein assembly factor BamB [Actinomycetes bacterium]
MVGVVATLLAIISATVVVNRFVLHAEWWQVDQRFARGPAPELLDVGPPPGPVTESWRLDTPVHHSGLAANDQVAYALVDGQLVVATGRGLDVRDARTGGERWHYYRAGWLLLGWAATRTHVVAYLEPSDRPGAGMIAGFDAATGRPLWRQRGELPAGPERTTLRWPAGQDVVMTVSAGERGTLRGRSAATGQVIWTSVLPRGCALADGGTRVSQDSETLAAFSLDCAARSGEINRVLAVDPRTGQVPWSQEFGSPDPLDVAVHGDVVLVSDGSVLRAYDRQGREFVTRPGEDLCGPGMCPALVADGRLVIAYSTGRLEAFDVSAGRSLWARDTPAYEALMATGTRLYGLRANLAANLLPSAVDVIGQDGAASTVPAPLVVPAGSRPWLGAGGGMLYVAVPEATPRPYGGQRLIALVAAARGAGPQELRGVPAVDWPDACALLHRADLPGPFRTRPEYAVIGGLRLPHAVSCTYEPTGRVLSSRVQQSASAPTVTVEWVARDPRAASRLMAAWRATETEARPAELGDEAYELDPSASTVAVRAGRYIIAVSAYQTPGMATRLARAATLTIRRAG